MGKGKKGKKKGDDDDWENDIAEIAKESGIDLQKDEESINIEEVLPKKKGKKKKEKAALEGDADEEDHVTDVASKKQPVKPSFSALEVEDLLSDEEGQHTSGDESIRNEDAKGKQIKEDDDVPIEKPSSKERGKKATKKKTEQDEDIDAILADIEGDSKQIEAGGAKKGKKKGKQKQVHLPEEQDQNGSDVILKEVEDHAQQASGNIEVTEKDASKEGVEPQEVKSKGENLADEDGSTVKSAAQKRAEKKEREKQKKKQEAKKKTERAQDKTVEEKKSEEREESVNINEPENQKKGTEAEPVSQEVEIGEEKLSEEEEDEGEKKKKKKKKKKGKDEDEKKKGKKPGKAAIKQMQEALEKLKLEEEKQRQEEEAKQKALEEAENRRLEKIRLEQEKKERKKQKEKERKERLKKEGKLLTPAQKEQKRRNEMLLEQMKQQGISVPSKDSREQRKKVQYVKKKKNQQVQRQTSDETSKEVPENEKEDKEVVEDTEQDTVSVPEKDENISKEFQETKSEELPDSWEDHHDGVETKPVKVTTKIETDGERQKEKQTSAVTEPESSEPMQEGEEDESNESESESREGESEEDESEEESSDEETESSEEEHEKLTPEKVKEKARERILKRRSAAEARRSVENLRCPVVCVLGHVDTGKTKILDKIRHTNVQDGEAGGITQQIGATMVPLDAIKTQTKMAKEFQKFDLKLPGLLIIDTPGHESFSNLRTRGSSLCDMAILVVDIMHGLEPQTIESINLLRKKHTPFIVALNKIDRLFEWKRGPASQVEDTVKKQKKNTKMEFEERAQQIVGEFAEQGLNAELFYKNPDEKNYISLVPTSAHSGDGMGDLIALLCRLTQTRLAKKLAFSEEIESTVMEVKALPGLGTTADAILVNGKLKEGDTIVTGGIEGPIVTQIRAILTPQPLRELRVKSNYIQHKELNGAQGCKITGKDLEKVMAGAPIFVAENPDEIEPLKDEVNDIVRSSLKAIKVSERGVYVQASTLGSLEALLEFLKTSKIPYSGVNVGPVHKRDVMRTSVMLEHEPLYAAILAFDVKVERDAQDLADKEGIKIFTADIIYHLFDKFTAYTEDYKQKLKDKHKNIAVFPCKLRILPQHIFNSRDPIVIGVHIEAGTLKLGTPVTVPSKEFCDIGIVTGIEANHKNMDKATAGQEVCVKIEPTGEAPRLYGRHFTHEDLLMSKISRESIDCLKNYFRDEMTKLDWQLIIEMKKIFEII